MFKSVIVFFALATASLPAQAALPGSAAEGKKLHEANCMTCHDNSVYTRKNRSVKSLDALSKQINSCGHMGNVTIGKAQADNLVKYLNEAFYKFK